MSITLTEIRAYYTLKTLCDTVHIFQTYTCMPISVLVILDEAFPSVRPYFDVAVFTPGSNSRAVGRPIQRVYFVRVPRKGSLGPFAYTS